MILVDEGVCAWVAVLTGGEYIPGSGKGIGWIEDGVLVAGSSYDNYNGNSVFIATALLPGHCFKREFLWTMFHYPFEQLKVKKLLSIVDSADLVAIQFNNRIGAKLEATLADAGKVGDLLIFSMTADSCKYLKRGRKNGKE